MSTRMNRRRFLKAGTAAAGLGYFYTATATSAARAADSPSGKLRFAGIGVGGKGGGDTTHAGGLGDMVALCDIDENTLAGKAREFPAAKKYFDFRKMLDEMGKQIDAVTVSTPDHTHAPASIMAMKLGKHVYTQKPLTHTVFEARQMRQVAKQMGVCTQMGNQGSSSSGLRRAVEVVQSGVLGPIREAHVWTNRPVWPQAPQVMSRPPESPVPATVHWNEWIGPAPMRPYSAGAPMAASDGRAQAKGKGGRGGRRQRGPYHDFNWRGWWDFGTGALGDMACHTANMAFRALKLAYPVSVVADATDVNPETYPSSARIAFEFPARGELPPVTFTWYEGRRGGKKLAPPDELLRKVLKPNEQLSTSGSMLVGDRGILFSPNDNGEQYRLIGEGIEDAAGHVKQSLPRLGAGNNDVHQKEEWVKAIKENKPAIAYSNFDFAAMLTETILLGNIAIRMNGQKLDWDGPGLKFTNSAHANQYVHYEYRKGWTL
jgi:predicted dehydrogenase